MLMRHDTLYGRPCRHDANGRIITPSPVPQRLALDRTPPSIKSAFIRAKKLEQNYAARLRKIARHIGDIVREFPEGTLEAATLIRAAMGRYAKLLEPWAEAVGQRMVTEVAQRDEQSWKKASAQIGRALADEIAYAPTGTTMQRLMAEQVSLITSLPIEAAERVHTMTLEGISNGERASSIAAKILETGEVTMSRATLIARTEVARTSSILTQVRAQHVGSTSYIWRTAGDQDVRKSHKRLSGKVFDWSDPPECDPGHRAHPGQIWNCFPGSVEVSLTNGCHNLWRRWYQGRLVLIEHEEGFLELTPNHPILTTRGWVAANDIEAGDYVMQSLRDRRFALQDNEDEGQPTFGDLFAALDAILDRKAHRGFLFDFHGDIPDDDINAIVAEHVLPGYGVSEAFESACNLAFTRAYSAERIQGIASRLLHVGKPSGPRGGNQVPASFGAHRLHTPYVSLASASPLDAITIQNASYQEASAFDAQRNTKLAFAADVSGYYLALRKVRSSVVSRRVTPNDFDATSAQSLADQVGVIANSGSGVLDSGAGKYKALSVIKKSFMKFSDHVYTMQTANGWFPVTSSAIVTKNCRCYAEPILPE